MNTSPAARVTPRCTRSTPEYVRRLIGQRTRDALAEKRAQGVRLGGPQLLPLDVVRRVVTKCTAGRSLPVIAAALPPTRSPPPAVAAGGTRAPSRRSCAPKRPRR